MYFRTRHFRGSVADINLALTIRVHAVTSRVTRDNISGGISSGAINGSTDDRG